MPTETSENLRTAARRGPSPEGAAGPVAHGGEPHADATGAPAPEWVAYLETVLLALGAVAIGTLVSRADPLLLRRGFPWVALAPILAGLRYGSLKAFVGTLVLNGALVAAWRAGCPLPASAVEAAAGWTIVGLVAGEFGDAWRRRARALQASLEGGRRQAEALWRSHLALQASFERVRRLATSETLSLSESLDGLSDALAAERAARPAAEALTALGGKVLAVFAQYAYVQAASVHLVAADGLPGPAVARLGEDAAHDRDPLALAAAASGAVESVRERGGGSSLLVAVPLVDVDGRVHGIVAVRDMPFLALHDDTLKLLAVIGGRVGEGLARAAPAAAEAPRAVTTPAGAAVSVRAFAAPGLCAPEPAAAGKTGVLS